MHMGVGLGIERIGHWCLRAPIVAVSLIAVVSFLAVLGIGRIDVDDSLSELFRSDTKEFKHYEAMANRFPSSEFDVFAIVEGDILGSPQTLDELRNFVIDLQLVGGAEGVISLFSARQPLNEDGFPPPLVPDKIPGGAEFEKLRKIILDNEIIKDKLLSPDGRLALIVLPLSKKEIKNRGLSNVVDEIKEIVNEQFRDSELKVLLSGVPVMQLEIRNAVQSDRILYNGIGFLLGAIICFIFFRRISLMAVTIIAPALAILWSLGTIGFLDYRLNLFLNVITPLIMVISFADAMHMVFAIRRRLLQGDDKNAAISHAISQVGPACVLTSLTTAIALFSLYFSQSSLIQTFAIIGAFSAIIAFLAVITVVPTVAALCLRNGDDFSADVQRTDAAMSKLAIISDWIGVHVVRHPYFYTFLGVFLVIIFGAAHLSLETRYSLGDQVPDKEQAVAGSQRLDEKLSGAKPVHVMVEFKNGQSLYTKETLDVIKRIQETVETQQGVGNVWSIEMLRRWLEKSGLDDIESLKKYMELLPKHLVRRFVSEDEKTILITGRVADIDANDLLPIVDNIEGNLQKIRGRFFDYDISVTGLAAVSARYSNAMITALNYGLISTVFVVVILLSFIFRSLTIGIISFVPNIFPIFAAGICLYLSGIGLQFASVVALTVAFGLAVDDAIHYLHRMQLEDERSREENLYNLVRTMDVIGPVMILTTIVLILGLSVTIFSGSPSLRLFGWLNAVTLSAALLAVLVFLPASMATIRKLRGRAKKPKKSFLDLF